MSRTFSAYPGSTALPLDPVVQKHLRRVYTSLTTALVAATAGAFATLYLLSREIVWPANVAAFLVIPALLCFSALAPHSPRRALAFHSFAFLDGCAAAPLLSLVAVVDPRIPPLAFLASAAVFACCSLSAIFAKRRSYLFLSSFLFTGLFGLSLVSLIGVFWRDLLPFSGMLYIGLILFCGFVLYDTQAIIEKAHLGERDHLKHALELLIDFLAIFKRVMIIMARNQQRRSEREERQKRTQCTQ